MKKIAEIPEKLIISLQVSGFVVAFGMLFFLPSPANFIFGAAFTVHFVGDLLRFLKDGL
jgi:hypothetical protein